MLCQHTLQAIYFGTHPARDGDNVCTAVHIMIAFLARGCRSLSRQRKVTGIFAYIQRRLEDPGSGFLNFWDLGRVKGEESHQGHQVVGSNEEHVHAVDGGNGLGVFHG